MYDKLANNNDYKADIEGAIEGVKTSDNEIQVELNNGMRISAMGDFEESIRLMVKEIKSKRKEWDWVNSLTKDIGINKGIYDIFFVNSKGVKVNTGKGENNFRPTPSSGLFKTSPIQSEQRYKTIEKHNPISRK